MDTADTCVDTDTDFGRGCAPTVDCEFTATYRRHAAGILSMLRVLVPAHVAEEITHEVFLTVWNSGSYDPTKGSQRGYLNGVARHKALDWIRRHYAEEDRDRRWAARRDVTQSVDEFACARDDAARVRQALEALGPDRRQAIYLAYFGGLSYRRVAIVLKVPEGTVKTRIRDGLTQLRRDLGSTNHQLPVASTDSP